jgi:hypothetical protein
VRGGGLGGGGVGGGWGGVDGRDCCVPWWSAAAVAGKRRPCNCKEEDEDAIVRMDVLTARFVGPEGRTRIESLNPAVKF